MAVIVVLWPLFTLGLMDIILTNRRIRSKGMADNLDSIIATLSSLTVLELNDLRKKLEEKWDVKATVAVAAAPIAAAQAEVVEQKTEFDVELVAIAPEKKLNLIKLVRELVPNLGLTEAKSFVESLPKKVKEGLSAKEAAEVKAKLEEAGATTVVIK